ncbi:hypothetical protein CEXT_779881 [Caerostris extrusa]|uniref:Uncharacterized protein n=1 Tax=Caerostris extrusa TaxID=172846 RepID=A0AAV4UMA2_CAEEX|nr:hypothetical protein CEXT_779881 [Caerostris extrusa]
MNQGTPKKGGREFPLRGNENSCCVIHQKTALSRSGKVGDRELRCVTGPWPKSHVTPELQKSAAHRRLCHVLAVYSQVAFPTSTKGPDFIYAISESTKISV